MTMCYDGTLVLPNNCAYVTQDEMQYIEGGGTFKLVITASFQKKLVALGLAAAAGAAIGAISAWNPIVGGIVGSVVGVFLGDLIKKAQSSIKGDITFSASGWLIPNKTIRI